MARMRLHWCELDDWWTFWYQCCGDDGAVALCCLDFSCGWCQTRRLLVSSLLCMPPVALCLTLSYRPLKDCPLGLCMHRTSIVLYLVRHCTWVCQCQSLSNLHCVQEQERRLRSFGQRCLSKDLATSGILYAWRCDSTFYISLLFTDGYTPGIIALVVVPGDGSPGFTVSGQFAAPWLPIIYYCLAPLHI